MTRLIFLFALLAVALALHHHYRQLPRNAQKTFLWKLALYALIVVLVIGSVSGKIPLVGALIAALLALAKILVTALGRHALGGLFGRGARFAPEFHSDCLQLQIDPRNGHYSGEVLAGPLAGRRVESLSASELEDLIRYCEQHHPPSALVLKLLRRRSGDSSDRASSGASAASQELEEARLVLGLDRDYSREDVERAHKKLIQMLHPDRGGNDYLAAKVNSARDTLLRQFKVSP